MSILFPETTKQKASILFPTSPTAAASSTYEKTVGEIKAAGEEYPVKESWWAKGGATLGKILDVLRTGEYAVGGLISGKGIVAGVKEKISPSKALNITEDSTKFWSKRGLAGLAVDILLDPVTYLTFGTGGAIKLTTKGGQIALSKSGKSLLTEVITKGASESAAKRVLAKVIQEGGESATKKYIAKSGLKFMGQEFVPREIFTKAGAKAMDIPGMNLVNRAVTKAFRPFKEIEKITQGKEYVAGFKEYSRLTRTEMFRSTEEVIAKAKPLQQKFGKEVGERIGSKIETGKLTKSTALNDVIKWMQFENKRMLQVELATGKQIGKIDNYLRHYITPEGAKWLESGKSFWGGVPKILRAKLQSAKPRKISGTIEEINRIYKEKHGIKNFFEPDAFKAFAKRKAEHIQYINTHNYLEATARRFGKLGVNLEKFKKVPGGYAERTKTSTIAGLRGVAKKLGKKPEELVPELLRVTPTAIKGQKWMESTAPQLRGYLFPEEIVKHIDEVQRFLTRDKTTSQLLKIYDKALTIWKGSVTGFFPAFHTRNAMGGVFNNFLAGLYNPLRYAQTEDILRGKDKIYKSQIGVKYSGNQVMDLAERYGVVGQPGMMDVAKTVDDLLATGVKAQVIKTLKGTGYTRWAMEQVENRVRLPLFLDRLMKGDTAREASMKVFKFHFDYMPEGLTSFEREAMRRVIPFYVWTRNNIPLQIGQMLKQPGKYAALEKTRQSITGQMGKEEFGFLPDYLQEMFIMRIGKDAIGKSLWMQLDLPLEDLAKLPISPSGVREIASMLSPFLKFPVERYMNQNFYFGGEIWNPDLPREAQTAKTIEGLKHLPGPIKKYLNFREVQYRDWNYPDEKRFITRYEIDARKLHLAMSVIGRFFYTLKGVTDEEMPAKWKASRYVGGVPVRQIDIPAEKADREYEEERAAKEYLRYLKLHGRVPYKTGGSKKKTGGILFPS